MGLLYVKTADGRKKPSIWVWLTLLAVLLGISIFLVTNNRDTGLDELTGTTKRAKAESAPIPVEKRELEKTDAEMDATTRNEMLAQIKREKEENNGYITDDRIEEITDKYRAQYEEKLKSNFNPSMGDRLTKMSKPEPTPPPTNNTGSEKPRPNRYMTLAERLGAEGINKGAGTQKGIDFAPPTEGPWAQDNQRAEGISDTQPEAKKTMVNMLPLGTFIPCVLDGDIVTNALAANVWANVVIDVTFRRQLQLPKGLVKVRGKTATEPVQNVVDIVFDTMIFSDGTELPINGFAYSAFDPRYPHRFRTRGIPGELIVPPMWVKLQSLIYSAALGASDAYIQNYINENTQTDTSFTTTPVIDPITGATSSVITEQAGNPVNNQIGATIGLGAGQAALEELVKSVQKDMEKYVPYLIVEKGTPFFIQLEKTVDIGTRQINGTAIAQEAELQRNIALSKQGVPMPNMAAVYPPGDARAQYTGVAPTTSTTQPGIPNMNANMGAINTQLDGIRDRVNSQSPNQGGSLTAEQVQQLLTQ